MGDLLDRRQTVANATRDALCIDLLSVLAIAAGTALMLALVGILLGSWLSARTRLTNFALLRALGSEPAQLASVLLWEQGIIYALALGLGVIMGFVLAAAVLPVIVFTNGTLQQTSSPRSTCRRSRSSCRGRRSARCSAVCCCSAVPPSC